ncbi:TetR/AcrR family transcriptional regulator [Peterkaempfera sp. SMS 1(5)a]|uniref:TetR/AcrR family transcriptional regulator n=1 Tax=Peterkaempfera podocarpi TaxID=3232308 RepID=UPI00366BDDBD
MTAPLPENPQPQAGCCATSAASRRRGKDLEHAIFEATLDQLTSGGLARLTMEGVAGAARTGKAALYRRWTSKHELVLDALESSLPPATDIPDRGSVAAEFHELMDRMTATVQSPGGRAIRVLMGEMDHEHAEVIVELCLNRVMEPAKRAVLQILQRGEGRGDVRPGAANPLVADVVPALLLYRSKVHGGELPAGFADEVVDQVLLPMVRPAPEGGGPSRPA